jgi:membrane protease YdiL (CAAX protease family)
MTTSNLLIASVLVNLMSSTVAIWLMRKMQVFNINDLSFGKMGKSLFLTCVGIALAITGFLFIFILLPSNRFIAPSPLDYVAVALSHLIGVGIYEEVLFRGLVFKILLSKSGDSKRGVINACVVSSSIFGMTHVANIFDVVRNVEHLSVAVVLPVASQVIFTTAFGMLAVAIFLRFGTLWIPIVIHGVGNLVVQTFVAFISRDWMPQFLQTPTSMSISEFITSTLTSTIPVLGVGLLLLRNVNPNEIAAAKME